MESFGLQPESYNLAANMLLKHNPLSIETLRTRFTADFLPDLVTSRSNNSGLYNFANRIPLPGLGSDYWRNSRAHLFCGTMPPKFPKALNNPAIHVDPLHTKDYLDKLYPIWSIIDPKPVSKVVWELTELEVAQKMFPLLRMPDQSVVENRYQNGTKIV